MALVFDTATGEDMDLGTGSVTKLSPAGGTQGGTQISISTLGRQGATTSATTQAWTPGAVASLAQVTTTITVAGCQLGDFVLASFSLDLQLLALGAYVSSANTVTVTLSNMTNASVTIGAGTLKVLPLLPR
jgi:hypothetical protein